MKKSNANATFVVMIFPALPLSFLTKIGHNFFYFFYFVFVVLFCFFLPPTIGWTTFRFFASTIFASFYPSNMQRCAWIEGPSSSTCQSCFFFSRCRRPWRLSFSFVFVSACPCVTNTVFPAPLLKRKYTKHSSLRYTIRSGAIVAVPSRRFAFSPAKDGQTGG